MALSTITIPESLTAAVEAGRDHVDLPRWALEAMVVAAVREGLITGGFAGGILGLSFDERERFLAERGIVRDYSEAELEDQQRAIDQVLAR